LQQEVDTPVMLASVTAEQSFDELLEAARSGQEAAVTALYRRVTPRLLRYLRARVPDEADDLCSDVWMVLSRRLPEFVGSEGEWWALVFTVSRRAVNDHWKRRGRRRTDAVDAETFVSMASASDPEADGVASLSSQAAVALVNELLSPDQAEVVLLRVVAGLDVDEVAAILGKRPGTVRVLQHRALKRLATHFDLLRTGTL
jgi:RNA polymerase sigma-70 factor (ECF subfamily)